MRKRIKHAGHPAALPAAAHSAITVLYGNCRGLKQAHSQVNALARPRRPTLIMLNETKLSKKDSLQLLTPPGYKKVARLDRDDSSGGGLVVFAEDFRLVNTVDVKKYNTVGTAELVCVEYLDQHIALCYTQKSATAGVLFDALERFRLDNPYAQLTVLGDFNAHHQTWLVSKTTDEAGRRARAFSEVFEMPQIVDAPTRGENTLDLVFSDTGGTYELCPHFGTSDHLSLFVTMPVKMPCPAAPASRLVYMWKSAPWNHIKGYLKRLLQGWDSDRFESVDAADRALNRIQLDAIKKYVKQRMPGRPKPTPWWDKHCQFAFVAKQKAFKHRAIDPSRYAIAKRSSKRAEATAFKAYQVVVRRKLDDSSSSSRDFWSLTKQVAGLTRSCSSAAPSVEKLAAHFASKMTIDPELDAMEFEAPDSVVKMKIRKFQVSRARVLEVLESLNVNKAVNGVSPRFLRECAGAILNAEHSLHKRIVRDAVYPTDWKCPRVTAIHKRDEVTLEKNYRPVSALPNRSLVFERTLAPQIADFCESITPDDQFGFVRKCGTGDYGALLSMVLQDSLNRRLHALLVSLDVAGAFDKAWHKALLAKLKKGGLRGKALKLIESYLFLRALYVVMAGESSKTYPISCGVPQGAVWSPNFWDVAVNDLSKQIQSCKSFNYADDSALLAVMECLDDIDAVIHEMNADMERLRVWGLKNNLTFDPGKNSFLVVSRSQFDFSKINTLEMGGVRVKYAKQGDMKLVGFIFDKKLSWSTMISNLASKARNQLGALWRLRPVMDSSNLQQMYRAFVRSIMEYGGLEYMSARKTHLDKLDAVQRSAERICSGQGVFEPLGVRRECSAFGMLCKMLDGEVRGGLKDFVPEFVGDQRNRRGRSVAISEGPCLVDLTSAVSLLQYDASFCGVVHGVFKKLPRELIQIGSRDGWSDVRKDGSRFLCARGKYFEQNTNE
jgi:hypothetical protein